jgi:DNA-binding PadR family transcriptional regulator
MPRNTTLKNPESLRPIEFEILLVLSGGDAHGSAIIQEAEARSQGSFRIGAGTLYRALSRLSSAGLIRPSDRLPVDDQEDQRRRFFSITSTGREVAAREARRLEAQVAAARARALLSSSGGGVR